MSLPGLAGEEQQGWDQRNTYWQTDYDQQLRPVALHEQPSGQPRVTVEQFTFADERGDPAYNLRGQMIKLEDPSGTVALDSFTVQGLPLKETRTFPDASAHTSAWHYSATEQLLTQTDAVGHRQHSRYDVAGILKDIVLELKDASQPQPVLQDRHYNAAGQIEAQTAGNGVVGTWTYDPADGRLTTLKAGKPGEALRQDLAYFYDRVGNVLRIEDHTLSTVYFANQRVDGHRDFTYDSLYRLHSASGFEAQTPHLQPGLPELIQPIDPGRRYRYTEHYEYDLGNNLIELRHIRDGNSFTHRMYIDPASNRGVRWEEGDPEPIFDELFDPHGNQLQLQSGTQPLTWNTHDQLAKVTLLQHSNGLPDDEEIYHYSQGERVCKYQVSHTRSVTHRREVRYLPGLEIHTRSDGHLLHVIVLPGARCLHWVSGQPADIEANQLRYSLEDHLGSCSLELDRSGALISLEFYYPYGGTAWRAARSVVEADYKTIRYSGKEMDVSGLYYYGARYYAPWLQRWVSADPAGDVDGLNLYAMVGNNPIAYIDREGESKWPSLSALDAGIGRIAASEAQSHQRRRERNAPRRAKDALSANINRHIKILGMSKRRALDAQQQILNHRSPSEYAASAARRTAIHLTGQVLSYGVGIGVGIGAQALGAVAPGVGNVVGVAMGFSAKKAVSMAVDYVAEQTGASASVKLKGSKLSPEKIIMKAEYKTMELPNYIQQKYQNMNFSSKKNMLKGAKELTTTGVGFILKGTVPQVASELSATVNAVAGAVEIIHETAGAGTELSQEKIDKADNNLSKLINAINTNMIELEESFNATGVTAMHTFSLFGESAGDSIQSLWQATKEVTNELAYTQTMLRSRSSKFSSV
ncbi:RHS repeat-associated core domain-containing protein [Pseudomonas sp. A-RE-19]|uniref:RHS repeat-associated core domain-containing protein n=1 Tax=Pseudomonas sp. A-RE-19 TaxID=2832401 RepID=UPI001CC07A1E|nr:RHS repeat-associated core domain-containing protein [Pseudomonas sp. A-RE-19]